MTRARLGHFAASCLFAGIVIGLYTAVLKAASDAGWPYAVLVFAGFTALIAWPLSRGGGE